MQSPQVTPEAGFRILDNAQLVELIDRMEAAAPAAQSGGTEATPSAA